MSADVCGRMTSLNNLLLFVTVELGVGSLLRHAEAFQHEG